MFWQEDEPNTEPRIADDVVDLVFDIDCRELPVDHAFDLARALLQSAPWIGEDERIGIHSVHLAGSQNGWERPDPDSGQRLLLSRRTKLTLRAPSERVEPLQQTLYGTELDIGGCAMTLGKSKVRPLSAETTLIARQVVSTSDDEERFLEWAAGELQTMGIRIKKALCGKSLFLATADGSLHIRSLMLADLTRADSIKLQHQGLGPYRHLGCGLFIPHKGINDIGS
jgi:CRISPR-associated protein Cas6